MDKDFVPVWVTRKQERIAPVDMTDTHLRNAIAYIRRNEDKIRKLYLKELAASVAPAITRQTTPENRTGLKMPKGWNSFCPSTVLCLKRPNVGASNE